jgi:hypothetical protein
VVEKWEGIAKAFHVDGVSPAGLPFFLKFSDRLPGYVAAEKKREEEFHPSWFREEEDVPLDRPAPPVEAKPVPPSAPKSNVVTEPPFRPTGIITRRGTIRPPKDDE